MSVDRHPSEPLPALDSLLPPGFADQVMQEVGRVPRPSPSRAFRSAIRDRSIPEASAALSVAWRIIRRSTSMPVMVRAHALALVVVVAGSILGGGALAGIVAYEALRPIADAISEPAGDRDRDVRPAAAQPTAAPTVVLQQMPIDVEPTEPAIVPSDEPARKPATTVGSTQTGAEATHDDDGDQDSEVPDADEHGGDPGEIDEADDTDDGDDADEPDAADDADDAADGAAEEPAEGPEPGASAEPESDADDRDADAFDETDPPSDEPSESLDPGDSDDASSSDGGD